MRLMKSFTGVAAATALALSTLTLTAAPASAATSVPTVTTLKITKRVAEHGGLLSAYLEAETHNASEANGSTTTWAGTGHLQRQLPGSSTWTTISSDDTPSYLYFPDVKYTTNAAYRVFYDGADYDDYPEDVTYEDSYSPVVTVKVYRSLSMTDVSTTRAVKGKFKATPKFGGKKFIFEVKTPSGWKRYKTAKANAQGVAVESFAGNARGIKYRVLAPGDRLYSGVKATFTATRY